MLSHTVGVGDLLNYVKETELENVMFVEGDEQK
jgi:hypothetical protein